MNQLRQALLAGILLIVIIAFSTAWGMMVASAARQHDWPGVAFGLFILVCGLGASVITVYCRITRERKS